MNVIMYWVIGVVAMILVIGRISLPFVIEDHIFNKMIIKEMNKQRYLLCKKLHDNNIDYSDVKLPPVCSKYTF